MFGLMCGTSAYAQEAVVGLITKTEGNPFFVKMREGAQAKADELGIELRTFAGKFDGDNDSQIAAIENLIASGAKGFAIVPSDSSAIVPTIQQARDAGLLVIVLDTPLDPIDAADATFATDNRQAGRLIGQWAAGTLGAGVGLLSAYAIGLGVPFLVAALLLDPFMRFSRAFRRWLPWVERTAGVVLLVAGVLMLTGTYETLNGYLIKITPDWLIDRL